MGFPMLDVTILKVAHTSIDEARKLIPYVAASDVWSIEGQGASEEHCIKWELLFEKFARESRSRTQLKKRLDTLTVTPYTKRQSEYLLRNGVHLWSAERFPKEEAREISDLISIIDTSISTAMNALKHGDLPAFFEGVEMYTALRKKVDDRRDRHIGEGIGHAEERIRDRYEALRDVDPLRYTICLGGAHKPEVHAPFEVKVVSLLPDKIIAPQRVSIAYAEGVPFADLKREALAAGLYELKHVAHHGVPITLSDEEIDSLSYQELARFVDENIKSKSLGAH